jgi:pyridoxine 4-dehydrogenase
MKGAYKHDTGPNGSAEGIQKSVEDALKVLDGTKTIDVFEMGRWVPSSADAWDHADSAQRVDPATPIETSMKALAELVKEGKIGGVGLSEVNANTIRKAHAVHPLAAVEIELSLFTPEPLTNGIMDTCQERKYSVERFMRSPNANTEQSPFLCLRTAQSDAVG